jgi:hypothetical protein
MLTALRGIRQRSLQRGEWRTEYDLEDLAKDTGLDALRTADLFTSLVDEGYLRGQLLFKPQDPSEEGSAHPVRAEIGALTERGLVTIDELPDPDSEREQREREQRERSGLSRTYNNVVYTLSDFWGTVANFGENSAKAAAFTLAPVIGALAGFVASLIPLAYPAGLITLWIQMSNEFRYGFWRALYAASLAPSAVVVGKVTWVLLFAWLSALIPMWFWYAYARASVKAKADEKKEGARDKEREKREERVRKRLKRFKLGILILFGAYPIMLVLLWWYMRPLPIPGADRGIFWLLSLFLVFTVAEVVLGGAFFLRGLQEEGWEAARGPLYLGLAIVYAASIAAGVCLAGLQSPSLPTALFTLEETDGTESVIRVEILSNSSGYWYVVDHCNDDNFTAIPSSRVEAVNTVVEEPNASENRDSNKGCATSPETTIDSGPSGKVASEDASFAFSSSEPNSVFECSLNGQAYARCTSSKDYPSLSDGKHTFRVKATNAAGNVDNTPAERTWAVDTTGPNTGIYSGPSRTTNSNHASFAFSSPEAGATFKCRMDSGPYVSCESPRDYRSLSEGSRIFEVKARDALGNFDASPASRTFLVDTVGPNTTIDSGPLGMVNSAEASFAFSFNQKRSTFVCSLDGGAYARCTSPQYYSGLSDGEHIFSVKAIDAAGNTDNTPARRTWTIC